MEFFSAGIFACVANGMIPSPFRKESSLISHLIFADDVVIFTKANTISAGNNKRFLEDFKFHTGLGINCEKSTVLFSNCDDRSKSIITTTLNFKQGEMPNKYLGIPLISTRIKLKHCDPLISKLRQRQPGWKAKLLSFAGRIELIKSTLLTLHIFWASIFLFSKACLETLEKHIRNFFWGSFDDTKKMKTISWSKICQPIEQGGLGLRLVRAIVDAVIQRQVWYITSKRKFIWVEWVYNEYIKEKFLLGSPCFIKVFMEVERYLKQKSLCSPSCSPFNWKWQKYSFLA